MKKKLTKKASIYGPHSLIDSYTKEVDGEEMEFPVLTEEDVKMSDDLLKRLIPIPKYQEIIDNIRRKMGVSKFLNIITGENSSQAVLVEGILKSAIPPATNKVFKGNQGGYSIDASDWIPKLQTDPTEEEVFKSLVAGGPRRLDDTTFPDYLQHLLSVLTPKINGVKPDLTQTNDFLVNLHMPEVNRPPKGKTEAENTRLRRDLQEKKRKYIASLEEARIKTRDELNHSLRRVMNNENADCSAYLNLPPVAPASGGGGLSGVGNRAAPPPENPFEDLRKGIEQIEIVKKEKAAWEKRALDKGYTKEERASIIEQIAVREQLIEQQRRNFLSGKYLFGGASAATNKTGFQYYVPFQDTDFGQVEGFLSFIIEPENAMKILDDSRALSKSRGEQIIDDDLNRKAAWISSIDSVIEDCRKAFEDMGITPLMTESLEKFAKFVGYGGEDYEARFRKLTTKDNIYKGLIAVILKIMKDIKREQSALVIHNVDQTRLCSQPRPGETREPNETVKLLVNPVLSNFAARQNKLQSSGKIEQHRTVIFVTRNKLEIEGMSRGDIRYVDISSPTTYEEARALVDYAKEIFIKKLKANHYENVEEKMALTTKDFDTISNLLLGKSTSMALSILEDAFLKGLKEFEKPDGMLLGSDMAKNVQLIANEFVAASGGAIALSEPKEEWKTYQYIKDSAWGSTIEDWLRKLDEIDEQWEIKGELEAEKEELSKTADPSTYKSQIRELDKQIAKCEVDIDALFGTFSPLQLLSGEPGVGKSIFCKTFAKRLGFQFASIQPCGDTDSAAGSSQKRTMELITQLGNLRRTIVMWDEIDKAIPNAEDTRHHWIEDKKAAFLQWFSDDDYLTKLKNNQVIVIGTCNNPETMMASIQGRFDKHVVPMPDKAEHYAGFVEYAIQISQSNTPVPYVPGRPSTAKEAWEIAKNMVAGIDYYKIGAAFVGSQMEPRTLVKWFQRALSAGADWVSSNQYKKLYEEAKVGPDGIAQNEEAAKQIRAIWRNKVQLVDDNGVKKYSITQKPYILGFEFNTENLCLAAKNTEARKSDAGASEETRDGVKLLSIEMEKKMNGGGATTGNQSVQMELDYQRPSEDPFGAKSKGTDIFRDVEKNVEMPTESQPLPPNSTPPDASQNEAPTAPVEEVHSGKKPVSKQKTQVEKDSTDYYLNALRKNGLLKE